MCIILIGSFICICRCGQPLLQAKLGSSDLARIESIDGKIDRLSKIVSITTTAHPAKSTELPSWSVFKAFTLLTVNNMVWGLYGWSLCDKLKKYMEGKVVRLVEYVKDKIGK